MSREWQVDEILSMARGFQPACVLAAAAELDLFGAMGGECLTAEGIAGRLESDLERAADASVRAHLVHMRECGDEVSTMTGLDDVNLLPEEV